MKPVVFLSTLLILYCNSYLFAQKTIKSNTDLANIHVEFVNQLTDKLIQSQKCLNSLYWSLEPNRKSGHSVIIGTGYSCSNFIDDYYYNKLLEQTNALPEEKTKDLLMKTQAVYDIYTKINNLCRELEIYVRLKDYTKDQLKKSDEIYNNLQNAYDEYLSEKKKYSKFLEEFTNAEFKKQSLQLQDNYLKMMNYLEGEENLISSIKVNFCWDVFTSNLPVEEILNQITESKKRLESVKITSDKNEKLLSRFVSNAQQQLQEPKREVVDNYSDEARKSDNYVNSFINIQVSYFNEYAVYDFNEFCKAQSVPLLYHLKTLPGFKIDNQPKEYAKKVIPYEAQEIPPLKIKTTTAKSDPNTIFALNNYLEFVNEELRINYDFATRLYYVNNLANKQLEGKIADLYLSFSYYQGYAIPAAAYQKTISDSKYINKEYSSTLNILLTELYEIIKEKYELTTELDKYVNKKTYKTDKHAHLYELLARFEYLLSMFDNRKELLYNYIRQIYESYPNPAINPWNRSGGEMLKQLDANLIALNQVKKELLEGTNNKLETNDINEISRNLLLKEYDNLKGLTKIGRNNGLCPYTPYEDLATESARFEELFTKFPENEKIKKDVSNYYRDFVYRYNNIADDYNKFVDLARGGYEGFETHKTGKEFLLKNIRQMVFFKMTKPVINQTGKTDEPKTEKPEISMDGFAENNLVFLLDVSGSMKADSKLPLLRESFLKILPYLRNEDEISVVIFSGKGELLLNAVSCSQKDKISSVLNSLQAGGTSNFNGGLKLAYKTAKSNFKENANNRIVIATDGAFAIDDELFNMAVKESENKTYLSVFSFGNEDRKVRSLEKLAECGKGNYENIEPENAMEKLLRELQVIVSK
ncbi:MAG: VWA domain-containing protein [Bacteroidales bacterium]